MKKPIFLGVVLLMMSTSLVFAKTKDDAAKRDELKKLTEAKKVEINGSRWEVQIKAMGGKGSLPEKDTLTFQDGEFSSKYFSEKGFHPTNYTLTVQRDGPTVWETMQTSEKGTVTFWRGEWKDKAMSGIISRQLEKGNEEYAFTSSARQSISPTSKEEEKSEEKVENAVEEQPVVEKQAPKKGSKKKGWFTLDSGN